MRMTSRKKEILSYFEPDNLEWVTGEIGAPPFDVSGVAYLLHGMGSFDKRYQLESTSRTLESMVAGGLLERMTVYESRQVRRGGEGLHVSPHNRKQEPADANGDRRFPVHMAEPDIQPAAQAGRKNERKQGSPHRHMAAQPGKVDMLFLCLKVP